jgi:hypothetical protein
MMFEALILAWREGIICTMCVSEVIIGTKARYKNLLQGFQESEAANWAA